MTRNSIAPLADYNVAILASCYLEKMTIFFGARAFIIEYKSKMGDEFVPVLIFLLFSLLSRYS